MRWRTSYGGNGVVEFAGQGGERERYNRLRAPRATRPHTVGYIGGCDQEQGEIEALAHVPHHQRTRLFGICLSWVR